MSNEVEHSYGVIPYHTETGTLLILKHAAGHWALPKGHADGDEAPHETALRELREETGLTDITLLPEPIFEEHYTRHDTQTEKRVTFFLGHTATRDITIDGVEIIDYAWLSPREAAKQATYPETRATLERVAAHLARA